MGEAVAIAASYELPPRRYTELEFNDLYGLVLQGLFARWPGRAVDIDGLMVTPGGGMTGHDTYIHDQLVSELGIRPTFAETLNLGGGSFPCMIDRATMAIRAGRASAVLCIGAGKMLKPRGDAGRLMASAISDANLEVPYGAFIPALYGMFCSEYMDRYQVTQAQIARVAVSARKWANLNPIARMFDKGPVTVEEVVNSRPITTPFNFYDCSFPSDGGGAVIVARGDLARKWAKQPGYVLGFGEYHARGAMGDPGPLYPPGAAKTGAEAFKAAGMCPQDIKVAQLYDAFTPTPLILLEAFGFCGSGEAPAFVESGAIDPGGSLPVNTYGGLLSFGHTGDSSGMSLITAGAQQVMGEAGPTQVPDADRVLIHAYGGVMYDNATLILGREP